MDYVVLFFEDPPAAGEFVVVVVAEVLEIAKTNLP